MTESSARGLAVRAAQRSGVSIRPAENLAELQDFLRAVDEVWRPAPTGPPVTLALLRAITHAGGYGVVAWDGERPVGACLGLLASVPPASVHSHLAGVTAAGLGRGVGFALKLDQRAWALERGLGTVTWTYDPLVRRNAYFNTTKLAAPPTQYLADFYGEMDDVINAGQGSDRLLATWPLDAVAVVEACSGRTHEPDIAAARAGGASVVLVADGNAPGPLAAPVADVALVQVPADIEALRRTDPQTALDWRHRVRAALGGLMDDGWTVTGVARSGEFVLHAPEHPEDS